MQTACADSTALRTTEVSASAPAPVASRRHALAGLAAAPLAIAGGRALTAAAGVSSAEPDPHLAWYAEWDRLADWCDGPGPGDRDLKDCPEWHRALELEDLIASTPARTLAGAHAQLQLARYHTSPTYIGDASDRALTNAMITVERLVGEAAHA